MTRMVSPRVSADSQTLARIEGSRAALYAAYAEAASDPDFRVDMDEVSAGFDGATSDGLQVDQDGIAPSAQYS
jgi:hypothetical protein